MQGGRLIILKVLSDGNFREYFVFLSFHVVALHLLAKMD